MKKLAALLAVTVLLVGACKQNPFPETGRIVQREPQKPEPVVPPLILDVPDSVEVLEGQQMEFAIGATVPKPGRPLLTVQGLPAGAVFDPATLKVKWNPDYTAANEERDQGVIVKVYPVHLMLSSSEDPVTITQRNFSIIVRDVARPITVNIPSTPIELQEGKSFEMDIEVKSEDYPNGPFDPQIKNMPVGTTISRDLTNPSRFKVNFTPSFREVSVNEIFSSFRAFVDRSMEVSFFGPRGSSVTVPMVWRINDVREKPIVLVPTSISQGTSASFSISAEDPNGEEPPSLKLAPRPAFGLSDLKTETTNPGNAARGVNPSIVSTFRWTQIPPEKIGKTENVNFQACVKRSRWVKDTCTTHTVAITFEAEKHLPPIVDRGEFPLGTVRYVREKENLFIKLPVRDAETATSNPSVVVKGSDEVTWKSGILTAQFKKAGLKQFSVLATSVYGVTQVESFLVEVLPWSWSSVVLFGEGPSDPEVKSATAFFDSVQVANPALQLSDPRLLVLRDSAYLTTGAFAEPSLFKAIESAAATARNVFISTPMVAKLEGVLKDELAALEVKVGTPVADLTGYALEVVPGTKFTAPTDPISLQGKLTAVSKNPVSVTYGGKIVVGKVCEDVLVLKKAGEADVPVAVACPRRNKGLIVVAGFEFGDIQTGLSDTKIVKKWLTDVVLP